MTAVARPSRDRGEPEMWRHPLRASRLCRSLVLVASILLLLLAGCADDPEPELVDDGGLVEQAAFQFSVPDDTWPPHIAPPQGNEAISTEPPEGVDVRVVWTGLPCHVAPTVRVNQEQGRLEVIVQQGAEVTAAGQECPSVEHLHAVDLILQSDVTFRSIHVGLR